MEAPGWGGGVAMTDLERSIGDIVRRIVREELAATTLAAEHLTVTEYANRWKISESTVRAAIRDERLAVTRIGRTIRIAEDAQISLPKSDDATTAARLRLLGGGTSR